METVAEFCVWKNDDRQDSLEKIFADEAGVLGWEKTDTLYSFLGIYVIGLKAYYPKRFKQVGSQIKTDEQNEENSAEGNRNIYSNEYVKTKCANSEEFKDLNELPILKEFLENYLAIGNLIPIWSGGNVDRGVYSHCFDIPEIYFSRNQRMANALVTVYDDAYMEDIVKYQREIKLDKFLRMNRQEYKKWLDCIVKTIKYRTSMINQALEERSSARETQ